MILKIGKILLVGAMTLFFGQEAYCQATMGSLDQNADQSQEPRRMFLLPM